MNGKHGDDPITDITKYGLRVFGEEVDQLLVAVWGLCGSREQQEVRALLPAATGFDVDRRPRYRDDDVRRLRRELSTVRDRLIAEARDRGWES